MTLNSNGFEDFLQVQYEVTASTLQSFWTAHSWRLRHGLIDHVSYSIAVFMLLVALFHIIRVLINRYTHLREYPGPGLAAYTRFWLCHLIASGDSAQAFVAINKQYGPIARIGPNHLITDDPGLTQRVLAARSRYTRAPWFDAIRIDPHIANIVSERDPGKHDRMRHKMSAGYAGRELDSLESEVCERMQEFVNHIDTQWATDPGESIKTLDMARIIQFLTVDVITQLCFGKPLGFLSNNKDMFSFLKTIETQLPIVQHFTIIHEVNTLIQRLANVPWLKRLIAPSPRDCTGIGVIMGVSRSSKIKIWISRSRAASHRSAEHSSTSVMQKGLSLEKIC